MARIVRILVRWIVPKVQTRSFSSLSHLVLLATLLERYHHYPCFKGEENEILGLLLSWICVKTTWHQRILLFGILLFRRRIRQEMILPDGPTNQSTVLNCRFKEKRSLNITFPSGFYFFCPCHGLYPNSPTKFFTIRQHLQLDTLPERKWFLSQPAVCSGVEWGLLDL